MIRSPAALISALLRRVALARFLAGCAHAAGALAALLGLLLLALRLLGIPATPHPLWACAAVLVPAFGLWQARRARFGPAAAAAWLDRQHGLGGLLVTGLERDLADWNSPLLQRAALLTALPRPQVRPLVLRALPALLFLAAVLALPPLTPLTVTANPAITQAIAEQQQALERVVEQQVLDPRQSEALKAELRRLQAEDTAGAPIAWSQLDGLAARLQHELQASAATASKAQAQLQELAQGGAPGTDVGKALAEVAAQLQAAGLLATLPKDLAAQAASALDAGSPPLSTEQAQALAAAMSQALGQELGRFDALQRSDLAQLAAIDPAALAAARKAQQADGHVHTELCPGGT